MSKGLQDEGRVEPAYTAQMERLEERIELRKTARLQMARARECMGLATANDPQPGDYTHRYLLWETIAHLIKAVVALTDTLEIPTEGERRRKRAEEDDE